MKKVLFLMLFLTITGIVDMVAQIKIGEDAVPRQGAVLDLNSLYKGGLLLPNVDITDFGKIPDTFSDATVAGEDEVQALAGMVVWNTRKGWEGPYVWDGSDWKRLSGTPPAGNPEALGAGEGLFAGRVCFDVAQNNNSDQAGNLASRQKELLSAYSTRADFTDPVTRNQIYTFTPKSVVSNVRFVYIEDETCKNQIVASISGGNPANGIAAGTDITCNLVYKPDLNGKAADKSREEALKVAVYVVYNNNATNTGEDVMVRLDVAIQDAACCGAYTVSGSWLTFMCYNLGADPTLTTPEQLTNAATLRTFGSYFRWGRAKAWASGDVGNWSLETMPGSSAWGYGSTKTDDDPCPPGFRIPSIAQWSGLYGNSLVYANRFADAECNTWIRKKGNDFECVMIGSKLVLPLAGFLTKDFYKNDSWGAYWTSQWRAAVPRGGLRLHLVYHAIFGEYYSEEIAASVRCVAD